MTRRASLCWSSSLSLVLGISAGVAGFAKPIDATRPLRMVVGQSPGPAPEPRLDGARTGRSRTKLPAHPELLWRTRVEGTLERGLAVDEQGRIVVVSTTKWTELGADGRERTSFDLAARPVSAPVVLSDGTRAVVTADGQLVTATATGTMIGRRMIPGIASATSAVLLPWSDAGVIVAIARQIAWFSPPAGWRAETTALASVVELLERGRTVLAVTLGGEVLEWNGYEPSRRLASLGGKCESGAVLIGPNLVAAVVEERRLVEVDLITGAQRVRVPDGPLLYRMAPLVTDHGETRLLSADGLLLGHDAAGRETLRVALDPSGRSSDGGLTASSRPNGLAVVDAQQRVAFAFRGSDPSVLGPDGQVPIEGTGCDDPIALVPAGEGRLAGACATGIVWLARDRSARR